MSHIPFHPAVGFGDLMQGWFVVPQNPVRSDGTPLVPSIQATAPAGTTAIKLPALADLVAASFAVPQNPLMAKTGLSGCAGLGCGCAGVGCDGGANFYALNGLGGLGQTVGTDAVSQWLASTGSIGTTLADQYTLMGFTLPVWGWLAGAGALLYVASDVFSKGKAAGKRGAGAVGRRLSQYSQNGRVIAGYGSTTMNGRRRRPNGRVIAGYGSTTMNPGSRILTGYGSTVMNPSGKTNVVFNPKKPPEGTLAREKYELALALKRARTRVRTSKHGDAYSRKTKV